MSQLSWEYKVTVFCLMLSAFFCLLLGVEWIYGRAYRAEILQDIFKVNKAGFEMQPIPEYPFAKLPVEHYADLVERPVFFEKRRPIEKFVEQEVSVDPVIKPPPEAFDFVLTGIINTPKGVRALFQNPKATVYADKYKRLKQGDTLAGWKLTDIHPDKVNMQMEAETKELLLLKAKAKTPLPGSLPRPGIVPPGGAPPGGVPPNINPFNLKH